MNLWLSNLFLNVFNLNWLLLSRIINSKITWYKSTKCTRRVESDTESDEELKFSSSRTSTGRQDKGCYFVAVSACHHGRTVLMFSHLGFPLHTPQSRREELWLATDTLQFWILFFFFFKQFGRIVPVAVIFKVLEQ